MFMRLDDGSVWCLPDGYKVQDHSLDDIRAFLNPIFSNQDVELLDSSIKWSRALDGTEYMPGLVGLNNMKENDYVNVIIQIFARVPPVRDFFLNASNYRHNRSKLVQWTGVLLRKIWHPKQFKGQVSPHDFMQAVTLQSDKRFLIEKQGDPTIFLSWLLNALHTGLTGGSSKQSIITATFQGEMEVWTEGGTGSARDRDPDTGNFINKVEQVPFLMLGLDLPPAPLFKDALDRMQIPQVPLFQLLKKYNGDYVHENPRTGRRRYRVVRLPKFLVLSIHRFTKNNFFHEKNPSIINFPTKDLELKDAIPVPDQRTPSKYNLVASVSHAGKVGGGIYKVYINRKVEDTWYEVQDLSVREVLPQIVALTEAYIQVYERC
jgi:U4/U6.U5 tri-snRNP-associated protein 2